MRQVRSGFTLLVLMLIALSFAVSAQTPPQGQTPPAPPAGGPPAGGPPGPPGQMQGPPGPRWKPEKLTNLKALPKDTTVDQLMETMQHFRRSLNLGCLGCHKGTQGQPISTFDFADDSKETKETARKMIAMTADLNTKYADIYPVHDDTVPGKPRVTCATCHRGNRHPETEPPPPPPRPEGAPQGPPPGMTPPGTPPPAGQRPPGGPPL